MILQNSEITKKKNMIVKSIKYKNLIFRHQNLLFTLFRRFTCKQTDLRSFSLSLSIPLIHLKRNRLLICNDIYRLYLKVINTHKCTVDTSDKTPQKHTYFNLYFLIDEKFLHYFNNSRWCNMLCIHMFKRMNSFMY